MKELLFGMKEKKLGTDEVKNRAGESRSGAGESSQTNSPKESASSSTCEGDSSDQRDEIRAACVALFGSGIVVKDMAGRKIALYLSGRRHAGENLDDVLERRSPF